MRRVLARHPWIFWVVCLAIAAAPATLVTSYVTRARPGATRSGHDPNRARRHRRSPPGRAAASARRGDADRAGAARCGRSDGQRATASSRDQTIVRQRVSIGEIVVRPTSPLRAGPAALADAGTLVVGITDLLARNVRIGLDVQVVAEGIVLAERATSSTSPTTSSSSPSTRRSHRWSPPPPTRPPPASSSSRDVDVRAVS